jgi:hypothetical protein
MPRDLTRRQDIFDDNFDQPRGQENNPLAGVLNILDRCRAGDKPREDEFTGAIGTLLGMIGEEKRRRNANALPPQEPVDVQYPRAGRAIGVDNIEDDAEPLPETDALTVEGERGMGQIMQDMNVPVPARDLAPRLLNNIVDNHDGTFSSADGSLHMGNREMLLSMIQRTLQEIGNELERSGGQGIAEIGPNLRVNVTTRLPNGRRQLKVIDPRKLING